MPPPCSRPYASSHHYCRPASDRSVAYMPRHWTGSATLGTGVLLSVVPARPKLTSSPTGDQAPGPDWEHARRVAVRATTPYPVQTCPHRLARSIKAKRAATSRCIRNVPSRKANRGRRCRTVCKCDLQNLDWRELYTGSRRETSAPAGWFCFVPVRYLQLSSQVSTFG